MYHLPSISADTSQQVLTFRPQCSAGGVSLPETGRIYLTLPADQVVSWLVVTACTVAVSAVDSEPEPQGPRGSLVLFPGPPRPHESVQ